MMNRKTILSLLLPVMLCLWTGGRDVAFAQEEESVFGKKMQSRYNPSHTGFKGNFHLSAMGGYHRWLDKDFGAGAHFGIAFGKWFSPLHGARIEAGIGSIFDIDRADRMKVLPDVRASYLFDISSFLNGYDPARPGYFYSLAGLGYAWRLSDPAFQGSGNWNAQLGLGYNFRIFRGVDLFVEPAFEINGNQFSQQADDSWRGYYGGFRGTVGMQFRLGKNEELSRLWGRHPWFVTVSGGPAWQVAALPRSGFHLSLGFGEKLSDAVSLRLSGNWTHAYRKQEDNHSSYAGLRLDGIVDLLSLASGKERPFGISLLGGPEVGWIKVDEPKPEGGVRFLNDQVLYVGASAGLQLRSRLYRRISAFVEPRASFIPYVGSRDGEGMQNSLDVVLSGSLGLQYEFLSRAQRREAWQRIQPKLNLFAGLEGSYFRPLGRDVASGPLASIVLGGWINPLNGMMFHTTLGYFQDLQYGNGYLKASELSLSYLFHLTRFLRGRNSVRPVNLSLMAGAGYMLPIRENWGGSVLFRGGLDVRMHILRQTDLVARPEIDLLRGPSGKWSPALRGSFGLSYSMGSREDARFDGNWKGWYLAAGAGIQRELVQLVNNDLEEAPVGEYRMNVALGKKFTRRLDWRVSISYLSQLGKSGTSFAHRLRFASVGLDALYDVLGTDDSDEKWALSLVAGPEVGLQHRTLSGENSKGGGILPGRQTVSAYVGASAGMQVKYRFNEAFAAYLEPKYTLIPYVSQTKGGEVSSSSHLYGASLGLEYAFGHDRARSPLTKEDATSETEEGQTWFFQATGTVFNPFGQGYSNGPVASLAAGRWLGGRHGVMLDVGTGYFRDNFNPPQYLAMGEVRASYLFRIRSLVSLMGGVGYLIPEIKQPGRGSLSAHAGFDLRMPLYRGIDLVAQPQLELFADPHNVVSGSGGGLAGAFRGSFGLRYTLYPKGQAPGWDSSRKWFVGVSGGYQAEQGMCADADRTAISHNEYRIALSVGLQYTPAVSIRATGSFSGVVPMEESFRHSLRYASANLDFLYNLLADEDGSRRLSLSLLAGPEVGFFNKSPLGGGSEKPLPLPFRIAARSRHSIGAYLGVSAGAQLKVRTGKQSAIYLEQRYSHIPYVQALGRSDHRNASSNLWNTNLGIEYSFGGK